jgi:type VI secretion system protein ImpM
MGQVGAFGKIPALGDFFRLRAPAGFVEAWDGWLAPGLASTRAALGPRWDDCYMSAPIWRFTLARGLAGPARRTGVMMPSVDRVGRRFPLTLVAALPEQGTLGATHGMATGFHRWLEDVALDTLEQDLSRAALEERLDAGPPADTGAEDTTVVPAMNGAQALWSTESPDGSVRRLSTAGMPDARETIALFDLEAPFWAIGGAA